MRWGGGTPVSPTLRREGTQWRATQGASSGQGRAGVDKGYLRTLWQGCPEAGVPLQEAHVPTQQLLSVPPSSEVQGPNRGHTHSRWAISTALSAGSVVQGSEGCLGPAPTQRPSLVLGACRLSHVLEATREGPGSDRLGRSREARWGSWPRRAPRTQWAEAGHPPFRPRLQSVCSHL